MTDTAHVIANIPRPRGRGAFGRLRRRLHALYYGKSEASVRFRLWWIALDLVIIATFVAAPLFRGRQEFLIVDAVVAVLLVLDLTARGLACGNVRAFFRGPNAWVDLLVLATLLFPQWLYNFGFLRILRLWTLVNSEIFWDTVGRRYDDTRVEEVTRAVVNLVTFVFIATGVVYASFTGRHEGLVGYVDALYFTVTSLTTTGYGDVTLPGVLGKLLSIVIMISGLTLFFQLAQAVFQRGRKTTPCPGCGLPEHERDAQHCRRCGAGLPALLAAARP